MRDQLRRKQRAIYALSLLFLAGCANQQEVAVNNDLPGYMQLGRDTKGRLVTSYKIGTPYEVAGKWYYPAEDFGYREEGIASWYGPGFNGKRTANGEVYDMNALTAAHKTLPLPSVVKVTNLENGRAIKLRINDRGPFVDGRIIDLSRRAAQLLDVERRGVARVRVELVPEDSLTLKNLAHDARGQLPASEMPAVVAAPRGTIVAESLTPPSAATTPSSAASTSISMPSVSSPSIKPPSVQISSAPTAAPAPSLPSASITSAPLAPPPGLPSPQVTASRPNTPDIKLPSGIYVQAGAFTEVTNARRLEAQLSGMGNTVVASADVGGQTFHRVRVGPVPDRLTAEQLLSDMMTQGYNDARIVEE